MILRGYKMRLRRLELFIIGLTLAFAFFMGGFFTGRSWNAVNITAVSTQNERSQETGTTVRQPDTSPQIKTDIDTQTPLPASPDTGYTLTPDVQAPTEPTQPVGTQRPGDGRININLASQSELTDLPGIGAVLASRIIDYRRQHGDFLRIEDIRNVTGIGEKRYEAIQDKITTGQ